MIGDGDSCLRPAVIWSDIKKVAKPAFREGFYCAKNELLVDATLVLPYSVNLAHRYSHSLSQFSKILVLTVA